MKPTVRYKLALILGFLMLMQLTQAQNITIQGTVYEGESEEALTGVTVSIPAQAKGVFTDDNGAYKLQAEAQESIVLEFSYTGYKKQTIELATTGKTELVQDVRMQAEDFTTDEVVITAAKGLEQKAADVTVSVQVVKPRSIDLQATTDITTVLKQVPGVDDLNGQISIRGSSGYAQGAGSRVMVMLNGLPLLNSDGGAPDMSLIPVDNISQVEVVKGASSVLYGSSALGGVINIRTKDPSEKPLTSIRFKQTIYDKPHNKALDWDGASSAYISSAHIFHSRKIKDFYLTLQTSAVKNSGYRKNTDGESVRGIIMTKYKPKKIKGLEIGLNFSTHVDSNKFSLYWQGYHPDTTIQANPNNPAITDTLISGGGLVPGGSLTRQQNNRIMVDPSIKYITPKGNVFWYRGRFYRNNRNAGRESSDSYFIYSDVMYQTSLHENLKLGTGFTHSYNRAVADSVYGGLHYAHFAGVYSQLDGRWGRFNASLGVRLETVSVDTLAREWAPLLRAGLNYKVAEGTNIRASFGQGFRSPSIIERYISTVRSGIFVAPNPTIQSETGFNAELAARQYYKLQGERSLLFGYVDVAAFWMQFDNMMEFGFKEIDFSSFDIIFTPRNVANARIQGIELTTFNNFEAGDWFGTLSGGITYIEPRDLDAVPEDQQLDLSEYEYPRDILSIINALVDSTMADQPRTLKYRSRWTSRFSASVGYKRLSLTANFRYRSQIESIDQISYLAVPDLKEFRERHSDGQKIIDLILSYKLSEKSQATLTVDNAFNEEYAIITGILGEQRKFTLQFIQRF